MMNHLPRGADASSYSRPSLEQLRNSYAKASRELIILPEYIKSLPENPSMTITYEGLKLALKLLPLGSGKTLTITNRIKEIEEIPSTLSEKYDRLYKLTEQTITQFRAGSAEEWIQDIISLEEAKALVKSQEAQIMQALPDGSILIKRKKRVTIDQEEATRIVRVLANDRGEFSGAEVLQASLNSLT